MVDICNLSFYHNKNQLIFDDVSLKIDTGIYGLLGENGVGKTTLLHLIAGLLFPKVGHVSLRGYTPGLRRPDDICNLSFLPTEFAMPTESIYTFAKCHSPFYPTFSHDDFVVNLHELGIDGAQKLSGYSYGQQKKAMIAYLLALNTPITLLDEPTNGLDITSKEMLKKIIARTASDDKCLLISTHAMHDFENLLDHVIVLGNQKVLLNSSMEEVASRLFFTCTDSLPDDYLYTRQTMQGYVSVLENKEEIESTPDLELLYQVVLQQPQRIKQLFKTQV